MGHGAPQTQVWFLAPSHRVTGELQTTHVKDSVQGWDSETGATMVPDTANQRQAADPKRQTKNLAGHPGLP